MAASSSRNVITEIENLDSMNGTICKRWQMKIYMQLVVQRATYVLHVPYPDHTTSKSSAASSWSSIDGYTQDQMRWYEDDCVCRSLILGAMSNTLLNLFCNYPTALELWNALHARYVTEGSGNRCYLINKFVEYKMMDEIPVLEQVYDMLQIAQDTAEICEPMSEFFQVSTIIGI